MTEFANHIAEQAKQVRQAGGKIDRIKIESERVSDLWGPVKYNEARLIRYDLYADPDVDCYEIELARE